MVVFPISNCLGEKIYDGLLHCLITDMKGLTRSDLICIGGDKGKIPIYPPTRRFSTTSDGHHGSPVLTLASTR